MNVFFSAVKPTDSECRKGTPADCKRGLWALLGLALLGPTVTARAEPDFGFRLGTGYMSMPMPSTALLQQGIAAATTPITMNRAELALSGQWHTKDYDVGIVVSYVSGSEEDDVSDQVPPADLAYKLVRGYQAGPYANFRFGTIKLGKFNFQGFGEASLLYGSLTPTMTTRDSSTPFVDSNARELTSDLSYSGGGWRIETGIYASSAIAAAHLGFYIQQLYLTSEPANLAWTDNTGTNQSLAVAAGTFSQLALGFNLSFDIH